jgi:hypothetical protein
VRSPRLLGMRTKRPIAISLFVSLLTLLASGDDLNIARLVWRSTSIQVPSSHLPLDDETTDFVESPESEVSQCQKVHYAPPIVLAAKVTRLLPLDLFLPFEFVSSSSDHLHCNCPFTPLRC